MLDIALILFLLGVLLLAYSDYTRDLPPPRKRLRYTSRRSSSWDQEEDDEED